MHDPTDLVPMDDAEEAQIAAVSLVVQDLLREATDGVKDGQRDPGSAPLLRRWSERRQGHHGPP